MLTYNRLDVNPKVWLQTIRVIIKIKHLKKFLLVKISVLIKIILNKTLRGLRIYHLQDWNILKIKFIKAKFQSAQMKIW
jgi:hypothetical protein